MQLEPIDLKKTLVDLATYRLADRTADNKADPIVIHIIYAQDNEIYENGRIVTADTARYQKMKDANSNDLVNKFGLAYAADAQLLLHKKLADVLIDTAIDMRDHNNQFTVVMDGLRTFDSGSLMAENRPDLVESKLLAPAGKSAHNRALAVDSKLFELIDAKQPLPAKVTLDMLKESDEKGHLDDLNMETSNRFYPINKSEPAYQNRLNRLRAWQRASVKNKLPIANLIAEFWDDRVPGSPADMWRVLTCRAMCIGVDGNPETNIALKALKTNLDTLQGEYQDGIVTAELFAQSAHTSTLLAWDQLFTPDQQKQLEQLLGNGGGKLPQMADFIFHEWLENIHDRYLPTAGFRPQTFEPVAGTTGGSAYVAPRSEKAGW